MIKNKMKEKERSNKNNEGKNTDVFLKVWKDNFTRYGKELNVFYGGIKK